VISIRLSGGFVLEDDAVYVGASPGGYNEALPAATPNTVFTRSRSGKSYDVVQFTVKLIMDQRDILRLVDRITKNKLHIPLRIAYEAVPPNRKMVGKVYGSEPTVNVVMDFETILIPGVFRPLMPSAICEDEKYKHIPCPPRTTGEEKEGG